MDRIRYAPPAAEALGEFLTTEEIAKLLRTSPETVRYWVHIGKLKGFKLGRRRLFDQSEIDAFIANAREKAGIA